MADLIPANCATNLLAFDVETGLVVSVPVTAFVWLSGRMCHPILASNPDLPGYQAIEHPNGVVEDRRIRAIYDSRQEWIEALEDDPGEPEDYRPVRGGGAIELAPNDAGRIPHRAASPGQTTSPEDAASLRDLGVSGRACAPLERELGVETLPDLAFHPRDTVASLRGVSVDTMKQLDKLLAAANLRWDSEPSSAEGDEDDDDPNLNVL